ncbi:MAG TPA: hypothetical protein VFK05_19490, partial [Polyangiaceae bacterium]|nr:hypothetical protein [Polyangiaceae bacterium]
DLLIHRFSASDAQAHEVTQAGSPGFDFATSTFLDRNGDLWITGQVGARNGSLITFNGKTTKGALDLMAWRFTVPSGTGKATPTSEYYMLGTDQDESYGYGAMDSAGRLWLAGSTSGQFPGGPANGGGLDAFVAQVAK